MGDGAGEATDGGEFLALDKGGLGLLLVCDLEDGGGDGLDFAVGAVDGRVADVPAALFAGTRRKLAFEDVVPDGMTVRDLLEEIFDAFEGGDLGDGAADDLIFRQADGLGLTGVDADVAEVDGVEEREADGGGLVDGLEFGALALGLLLTLLEGLGEGLAVVDVDVDAEPVEDIAVVVAHGHGAYPKPAGAAVARADHSGFDVVVDAGGNGSAPGFDDARAIVRVKGLEPDFAFEIVEGEAEVVEQALVGVSQAAIGRSHPDGLGVEVGEDAVACLAGDEGVFVALAIGNVDGEAAEAGWDTIYFDSLAADFDPDDVAAGGTERKVGDDHFPGLNRSFG